MGHGEGKLISLDDMKRGYEPAVKTSADGLPYRFAIQGGRMFPNLYTNGFGKQGVNTRFTLKLGLPSDAAQFVGEVQSAPVGDSMDQLNVCGNQGKGVVHFAKGVPVQFQTKQKNLGSKESGPLEYRWEVYDHFIWGLPFLATAPADPKVEASHRIVDEKRRVIRVFPAMPGRWRNAIYKNLCAEGAFLVSAHWREGKTVWISIHSLAGSPCRVETEVSDFQLKGSRQFQIRDLPCSAMRRRFEIDLRQGETVFLNFQLCI